MSERKNFDAWFLEIIEQPNYLSTNLAKAAWNHQQSKYEKLLAERDERISELDARIEELEEELDGEVGLFYETMDYESLAKYSVRASRKVRKLQSKLSLAIEGLRRIKDEPVKLMTGMGEVKHSAEVVATEYLKQIGETE